MFAPSCLVLLAAALGASAKPVPETCTTTMMAPFPQMQMGPTLTVWPTTVVETAAVDCGDCLLQVGHRGRGPGPVRQITATVTAAEPSTTTVYECKATGN
ncbi:hypothetical protein DCS_04376 [Drechmeria coniospora]|uniref:Ig-like domain-containing protein n=1 Tax=Drechmeria coniospora TaxID=98403 RepID=A0A151GJU2_DRECN|nr:hypothetical protein DCS_04376 [Drechmeria coniospora]KYK57367.1 hypothetical protein DCS_04376 [Drechmeria coniospora]ODA79262.1 hypothetical protein RJ55_04855 [Drechmeria coniospora]